MKFFLLSVSLLTSMAVNAQGYDCKISNTIVRPEGEVNSAWQIFIKDDSGIIKLDGVLHTDTRNSATISRQIFFNVVKFSEQGYHFTSQRIKKNPVESISDEEMAKYFPDFFILENHKTMFTITRADSGFIMSWATDPMFYCN